jgi:hypothetical protein
MTAEFDFIGTLYRRWEPYRGGAKTRYFRERDPEMEPTDDLGNRPVDFCGE